MRALFSVVAAVGLAATLPVQAQTPDATQQWMLPERGELAGSRAEIENTACCGASRGTAIQNTDAAVVATLPGRAAREGGVLRLKLEGNRTFKLTDCYEQPACDVDNTHVHRLVAWWPNHRYYIVAVGVYEGSVAYVISERDGRTLIATAPPVLSPSGRAAVALTSDLMSGVELELIDLTRTPPTLTKIETSPNCPGASPDAFLRPKPVWIDDSHVRFEGKSPQPGDTSNAKQLLRVEGGKAAWEC